MAVVRTTRFRAEHTTTEKVLDTRARLIAAVRASHPGLTEARLARLEDGTWVDAWRWESPEAMQAALASAPSLPEAAAAFALATDATAENALVIDER